MSAVYGNWDRLVGAVLSREDLRRSGMRTPSEMSSLSARSSFSFVSPFDFSANSSPSFTYDQILRATDGLSSSELIFYGVSGDFYQGVLEEGGVPVVVKKVYSSQLPLLKSEMDFFAKVSHPRFVPLLGYCMENQDHKFVVYEHMENGDLFSALADGGLSQPLDWKSRLKVAIGVAQALCHLHHECVPPLVHRNVKASSILIDENYYGCLGGVTGVTEVCLEQEDRKQSILSKLLRFPNPRGSWQGASDLSKATCAYDVYCFGLVLLQLVTGFPVLRDVNSSASNSMVNILPYITSRDPELFRIILDPCLTMDRHLFIEMWEVAVVAKACLGPEPSKRPLMQNVLKTIEGFNLEVFSIYVDSPSNSQLTQVAQETGIPDGSEAENQTHICLSDRGREYKKGVETRFTTDHYRNGGPWLQVTAEAAFKKGGCTGKYGSGEFSMAIVQANNCLENHSQIESGQYGSFVGVYDGHSGQEASRYVCNHLYSHFRAILAKENGVVNAETIRSAFDETERGFTSLVSEMWESRPQLAFTGSCCLVGVIHRQTLFIANLGDSRAVLGKKVGNSGISAVQLSREHNANIEAVREELKQLHPSDPDIVVYRHGVWRVKGIIQVSRSIGDVYLKHAQFNIYPLSPRFRVPKPFNMPYLSSTPSISTHSLHPDDSFVIFASDGLWECLSNEQAVEIVHTHPCSESAPRLVKAALQERRRRGITYKQLCKIDHGIRRHFHDDITVIVLFLNHDLISRGSAQSPPVSLQSCTQKRARVLALLYPSSTEIDT